MFVNGYSISRFAMVPITGCRHCLDTFCAAGTSYVSTVILAGERSIFMADRPTLSSTDAVTASDCANQDEPRGSNSRGQMIGALLRGRPSFRECSFNGGVRY